MTPDEKTLPCPDSETLAALAEGRLDPSRLDAVLEHVEQCESCMDALDAASGALHFEGQRPFTEVVRRPVTRMWWLAAAASLLIVSGSVLWIRGRNTPDVPLHGPTITRLVELSPRSMRPVESRLSGGFPWAPYRGPMRANDAVTDTERMRLGGAAAEAIDRADRDAASSEAQHVAGVAVLLADDPEKATERLRAASQGAPNNPGIANDLAAALYAAALTRERPSLYTEALAAADRALRIDARNAEALFNRALILERLGLTQQARRAWETYLSVDPSSPWADEARRRLTRLPAITSEAEFKRDLPRLENAAVAGDLATVRTFVQRFPLQCRTYAEAEHLGHWGEAASRGEAMEAARNLAIARAIGHQLAAITTESLLHDAVAAIDRASHDEQRTLARAHAAYRKGRLAYVQQQLDEGERELRASARDFAAARSPMAFVARYFAACIRFDRHEAARPELDALLREFEAHVSYSAVRAQTHWELALCDMMENDWGSTLTQLGQAERAFARIGESGNLASIRSMLATALMSTGRPEEAWGVRARAFEGLSAEPRGNRLAVAIGAAARTELRAGRLDTARALFTLEAEEVRAVEHHFMLADALVRNALASIDAGDRDAAEKLLREAQAVTARISDRALHERTVADIRVAEGAMDLAEQPRRSIAQLTTAIDFYQERNLSTYLPMPYLYRARAWVRLGNGPEALRDLDRGIAEVERHPVTLDVGHSLYEDAIRLCLDQGDARLAFEYAERARAIGPPALDELQRKLQGTATVVLHLTALPDEIASFAVAANELVAARPRLARARIDLLTTAVERGESAPLSELYDVLIRPTERVLDRASHVIVIGDPQLERIPFAALYDHQRHAHLIERLTVASASSARALNAFEEGRPRSIVAVALPSGVRNASQRLPATEDEPAEIRRLYPIGRIIPAEDASFRAICGAAANHDVVHIAGHTERRRGGDDTALLLADGQRVAWPEIAATRFDRRTVFVLAGCETLRGPTAPFIHSMSIGAAFLAAGAGSVIGTLTPIADEDARELFLSIHRQLASGVSPAAAVRRVQLDAISSGRLPAWRSIAVATSCIRR